MLSAKKENTQSAQVSPQKPNGSMITPAASA